MVKEKGRYIWLVHVDVRSVAAGRSYTTSEASGGWEETPRVQDQGQPGEATSHPRPGAVTLRSHPEPEARGSSLEEPPAPKARVGGQEEQPEEWWLCRHRRAKRSHPTLKVRNGGSKEIPLIQGKEQGLCFAGVAAKRYPTPKVRETQVRW